MQDSEQVIQVYQGDDFEVDLTTCNIDDVEQMRYTTYGIRVRDMNGTTPLRYRDISRNRRFVENFARLCVEWDVRICHVADLLEDYLLKD